MAVYEFGTFRLDVSQQSLTRNGHFIELPKKPFDILALLVANSGKLVSKDSLMQQIWSHTDVEEGNLTVNMSKIRKVLGGRKHGYQYIATLPRHGYRFIANVRTVDEPVNLVAVWPFDHNGDQAEELAGQLVKDIVNDLSLLSNVRVLPPSTLLEQKSDEVISAKTASELHAIMAVSGTISVWDTSLTIFVKLFHVPSSRVLWGKRFNGEASNAYFRQLHIAEQIAEKVKTHIVS